MRNIYFSHETALEAIRELRISPAYNSISDKYIFELSNTKLSQQTIKDWRTISNIEYPLQTLNNIKQKESSPCDVLIPHQRRYKTGNIIFHICQASLPKNSFIKISDNVYITSPELTFFLLANTFSFYKLVLLGLELCGSYVPCTDETINFEAAEKGFIDHCVPATTREKLIKYGNKLKHKERMRHFPNLKRGLEALKCIDNNSASPKESQIFAILSGPRNRGMFNINNLKLNLTIELSYEASIIAGQNIVKPDICDKQHKIAIEYDSAMYHTYNQILQKDKRRLDGLIHDGWLVISIVPSQLKDPLTLYNIAIVILKSLKRRTEISRKDFSSKYNLAFNQSFQSNFSK